MTKIVFDNEEQQTGGNWVWHYGTLTDVDSDYPFTLCAMYEPLNDTYSYEVTWVEGTPENAEKFEQEIISQFNTK